jgi:two-component system cell cycle sensor histidine kinase/response regulator CckA
MFIAADTKLMSEPKTNNSSPATKARGLIYVVDDEPMLLELASVILQPLGFEVQTFRDPQLAVRSFAAAKPQPALIITDYAMHSTTGLDLIEACRRVQPRQKFLLLSGTVDEHIFRDSPFKPDRFLAKPYQPRQLVEVVESLLQE